MARLVIQLFGSPQIDAVGAAVRFDTLKALALLSYLAVTHERHRRDTLVNLLWPESSHSGGRSLLRGSLYSLRKALGASWVVADRETVTLDWGGDIQVDVHQFESLLAQCRSHGHAITEVCTSCVELLAAAAEIYRGDFLAGFGLKDSVNFDNWLSLQAGNLEREMESTYDRLVGSMIERGDWEQGDRYARRWLGIDQTNELAHRKLMELQARSGQRTSALHQYEQCVRILQEEMGVEPEDETRRLYETIRDRRDESFPTVTQAGRTRNNLPRYLTSFVGREREIAEIEEILPTTALMTLTGVGGCGKTRLALYVASKMFERYPDGVWFVDLSPVTDDGHLDHAVASALGIREPPEGSVRDAIATYLNGRQTLIVLDNCEQAIQACADLTDQLLQTCTALCILTTSREPLNLNGEIIWRVPSLSLSDGSRLLVDRIAASAPQYAVADEDAPTIGSICTRLDGIPLALELAAARVRSMSLSQILARLDDRFALLTEGSRIAASRHKTLSAAIEWSYELLSEKERSVLRRLSVFSGGCTLGTIEAVCSDPRQARVKDGIESSEVLDIVASLVDKSMVVADQGRYRLLETIRQFAHAKLSEAEGESTLRHRHLNAHLELVEQAEPNLKGADQLIWLERIESELSNIRSAFAWSIENREIEKGMRMCGALWWFWTIRGYFREGRAQAERLLAAGGKVFAQTKSKALFAAGAMAFFLGDLVAARSYGEQCLSLSRRIRDKSAEGYSSILVGSSIAAAGENGAEDCYDESLRLLREAGDLWGTLYVLRLMGALQGRDGLDRAQSLLEESLAICREVGDRVNLNWLLHDLGSIEMRRGNHEKAATLTQESLEIAQELGHKHGIGQSLFLLGIVRGLQSRHEESASLIRKALIMQRDMGAVGSIPWCLVNLVWVALNQARFERAAKLLGAIRARYYTDHAGFGEEFGRYVAKARSNMGEERYEPAWSAGQALSEEETIEFALESSRDE